MSRTRFEWKLKSGSVLLGERTWIAAVLDLSPEGAGGGRNDDPDRAFVAAMALAQAGADWVELAPAPLRAGCARVNEGEEIRRLIPVMKRLRGALSVPVAVQTTQAAVAEKACEYGAEYLHDPSGLSYDPELAKVAARHDTGLLFSHAKGSPEEWVRTPTLKSAVLTVAGELSAALARAIRANVDRKRVAVDPGLGLGKRREQDWDLLGSFGDLNQLKLPLSIGLPPQGWAGVTPDTWHASAVAAAVTAVLAGAHIVRVEEVAEIKAALGLIDMLLRARPAEIIAPPKDKKRPHGRERWEREQDEGPRPVRPTLAAPRAAPVDDEAPGESRRPEEPSRPEGEPAGGAPGDRPYARPPRPGDRGATPGKDRRFGTPPRFGGDRRDEPPRERRFGKPPRFGGEKGEEPPRERPFGRPPRFGGEKGEEPPRERRFGKPPRFGGEKGEEPPRERRFGKPPRFGGEKGEEPPRERQFGKPPRFGGEAGGEPPGDRRLGKPPRFGRERGEEPRQDRSLRKPPRFGADRGAAPGGDRPYAKPPRFSGGRGGESRKDRPYGKPPRFGGGREDGPPGRPPRFGSGPSGGPRQGRPPRPGGGDKGPRPPRAGSGPPRKGLGPKRPPRRPKG